MLAAAFVARPGGLDPEVAQPGDDVLPPGALPRRGVERSAFGVVGHPTEIRPPREEVFRGAALCARAGVPKGLRYRSGIGSIAKELFQAAEHPKRRGLPGRIDGGTAVDEEPGDVPAGVPDGVVERRADGATWRVEIGPAVDERGGHFQVIVAGRPVQRGLGGIPARVVVGIGARVDEKADRFRGARVVAGPIGCGVQRRLPSALKPFAADHSCGGQLGSCGDEAAQRLDVTTMDGRDQLRSDGVAVGQCQRGARTANCFRRHHLEAYVTALAALQRSDGPQDATRRDAIEVRLVGPDLRLKLAEEGSSPLNIVEFEVDGDVVGVIDRMANLDCPHTSFCSKVLESLKGVEPGREVLHRVFDMNGSHVTMMMGRKIGHHPRLLGFSYAVAVSEQIARRCRDYEGNERALRMALLEDIRRRVPVRAHVWALIDPETEVATAPLATVPDPLMAQLPGIVRRRYLTTVNRWDHMEAPVASLLQATDGDPSESLLHREVLGPSGVGDIASVVFRDRFGIWGFLDLWRFTDDDPFTDAELSILAEDVSTITLALRLCQARSFDEPAPSPERTGPAVLFLSPELKVLGQTPETDRYLRALLPPDVDRMPVPAGAYNVAAALLAHEAGIYAHPPVARVSMEVGLWLTFSAARVNSHLPADQRDIAVTIEVTSPSERRNLYARSHGLTARETELLERLALGADTRNLAHDLRLSEHTIQDHLKSIFAKTNTRNRRTLLSRIVGH